jgi:hypothetical protein
LQDKQLKQPPAVKQYKIIQAGTLVKSSRDVDFMWAIVLGPWICMFSVAQDKPLSRALFGPGATLNKKLHERPFCPG